MSNSLGYQTWQRVDSYNSTEGKNFRVIVAWSKKNYGKSYYDGEGFTLRAERTYPSLQLVDLSLVLPEKYLDGEVMAEDEITEEIKVVEKWQTAKWMNILKFLRESNE